MKPLGKKAYGSIPHLPGSRLGPGDYHISEGQARIATEKKRDKHDLIIVQEKLDGSNVAVAKVNGDILALTRSGYLASTSNYTQHLYFDQLLSEGERLCGEWLLLAHGTRYNLNHEPFVPFDIMEGVRRVNYETFSNRVISLGFTIPNLLSIGEPFPVEAMAEKIETSGHGAIDPVEGAIWRVERRGEVDFLAKYVQHFKQDGKYFSEATGQGELWNMDISKWLP